MSSAKSAVDADKAVDVGMAMARKIFEKRGNHSEIHLSEGELAGYLGCAYSANDSRSENANVSVPRRFLVDFLNALDFHNGHGTPHFDRVQAIALSGEANALLKNAAPQGRDEPASSGRTGEHGQSGLPDGDAAERRVGIQSHVESAEVPAGAAPERFDTGEQVYRIGAPAVVERLEQPSRGDKEQEYPVRMTQEAYEEFLGYRAECLLRKERATNTRDGFTDNPELWARIEAGLKISGPLHKVADAIIADMQAVAAKPDAVPRGFNAYATILFHLDALARSSTAGVNQRLLDALNGMIGLVQLVKDRYQDFPVDNHRVLEAISAANSCNQKQQTLVTVEPDGYAVLLDDPKGETPGGCGYWYVGAYRTEVVAKDVAARGKQGARVVPMYFSPQAGLFSASSFQRPIAYLITKRISGERRLAFADPEPELKSEKSEPLYIHPPATDRNAT